MIFGANEIEVYEKSKNVSITRTKLHWSASAYAVFVVGSTVVTENHATQNVNIVVWSCVG